MDPIRWLGKGELANLAGHFGFIRTEINVEVTVKNLLPSGRIQFSSPQ